MTKRLFSAAEMDFSLDGTLNTAFMELPGPSNEMPNAPQESYAMALAKQFSESKFLSTVR